MAAAISEPGHDGLIDLNAIYVYPGWQEVSGRYGVERRGQHEGQADAIQRGTHGVRGWDDIADHIG
jgi:hypothetical protein